MAVSAIRYTALPTELELEESAPFPHIPDELKRVVFQQAGINYGLLNKEWRAKYLIDRGSVAARVAHLRLLPILFRQIANPPPFTQAHLLELDRKIHRLYSLLVTHEDFLQIVHDNLRIPPLSTDPNTAPSYEYFKEHLSKLAEILNKIPHSSNRFVRVCSEISGRSAFFILLLGSIPIWGKKTDITEGIFASSVGIAIIIFCISCHCEGRIEKRYDELIGKLQPLLDRPLADIKAELRALTQIVID